MFHSYGRGGAGNMADDSYPRITPKDLETPTLKTSVITTGRGGSGNMFRNNDPTQTRLAQDVQPVVRRPSTGAQSSGRGGAGNIFHEDEIVADRKLSDSALEDDHFFKRRSSDFGSLASKGKQMLFGKK